MRIAIVCSRLGYGGAERVAVMWANGFANREHEVILISNLFEEQTYYVDERITLCNLVSAKKNKIKKWSSAVKNVRKVVNKELPDVIIGVMETCSLVARIATIGKRIPVIMTDHNSFERPATAPMSKSKYFKKYYLNKIYICVTVLTYADKNYIGNRLYNIVVLPNPLLLESVGIIPRKENIVLAAGRLDDWHCKGFDVLIKAFAKLVQCSKFKVQEDGWKLQIAGTGSEESLNYLKQLCKENRVEGSVEFLGFRKDVEKLYQDASIFVLSSRYEGFGLVLIEAMSQGCACIACDYKGRQREILCPEADSFEFQVSGSNNQDSSIEDQMESELSQVSVARKDPKLETIQKPEARNLKPETRNLPVEACETGILCEPDNVDALTEALKKMITDNDYRESVRAKAVERSKYYSIENTMDRWEDLLHRVMETH